jgi:REP element-mobilizing transposase RayT
MPRLPRNRSKSGIYHIVMRGINRQIIFEDEEDCVKFIEVLQRYREVCGYKLYAYCLMGNHLHLLLMVVKEPLEQIMRRICASYVKWFNHKYGRVGYLFQDRFKSESVEDDTYFIRALRYIYQNPIKAGLVTSIEKYTWSNYYEYLESNKITEIDFVLEMFNTNREKAVKSFIDYINEPNEDDCLDISEKRLITDVEAKDIIRKLCNVNSPTDLQKFNILDRNKYLKDLKKGYDLSIKQIERLTGINRGVIQKA